LEIEIIHRRSQMTIADITLAVFTFCNSLRFSAYVPALRNPITGIAGCCAPAARGHAAAPPSSEMNARHFTAQMPPVRPTERIAQ
jgi:hypothetical protein